MPDSPQAEHDAFMNHIHSEPEPSPAGAATEVVQLPHFYAYSHEPTPRKLWDEDDMREYAAAVAKHCGQPTSGKQEAFVPDPASFVPIDDQIELASGKQEQWMVETVRDLWRADAHNASITAEERRANDSIEENVRLMNQLAAERENYALALQMSRIESKRANEAIDQRDAAVTIVQQLREQLAAAQAAKEQAVLTERAKYESFVPLDDQIAEAQKPLVELLSFVNDWLKQTGHLVTVIPNIDAALARAKEGK